MDNNTDYRMVKLTDGTTIMGSIVVDKDFLRITNALELHTVQRQTEVGPMKDTTLTPWISYTDDKTFVIPRDKILVITQADNHISHYYEIILSKVLKAKRMLNLYYLPKKWIRYMRWQIRWIKCKKSIRRETAWSEEDLIDLFGKKTIH